MIKEKQQKSNYPDYTRNEERFNMITHIVGASIGIAALLACIVVAGIYRHILGAITGIVYGLTVILLFTISSIYHGLHAGKPKKTFQVLDHCAIYILIAGTYTPIVLTRFRQAYPFDAWLIFSIIWGLAILGTTLTAINRKRFAPFAIVCYLGMGWTAVFRIGRLTEVYGWPFIILLAAGGVLYTLGVLFYAIRKRYMHSVFHLFVNAASIIHSVAIVAFVMPM